MALATASCKRLHSSPRGHSKMILLLNGQHKICPWRCQTYESLNPGCLRSSIAPVTMTFSLPMMHIFSTVLVFASRWNTSSYSNTKDVASQQSDALEDRAWIMSDSTRSLCNSAGHRGLAEGQGGAGPIHKQGSFPQRNCRQLIASSGRSSRRRNNCCSPQQRCFLMFLLCRA